MSDAEFTRSRIVRKPRKEYSCEECGCKLPKDTEHYYTTGKYDEHFWAHRVCVPCATTKYNGYIAKEAESK